MRARVELDELGGDLSTALRARPLRLAQSRAAHLVEGRRLAADVARDLVELVGRHESRSPGWPRLDGAYSMTRYSRAAPCTRALHHLDVAADAVLLVHDEVAGLELQRVDLLAAAGRHLCASAAVGRPLADEVVSVSTARLEPRGRRSRGSSSPQPTVHDAAAAARVDLGRRRRRARRRPRRAPRRCAAPGRAPAATSTTRQPSREPAADVGEGGRRRRRGRLGVRAPSVARCGDRVVQVPPRTATGRATTRGPGASVVRRGRRRACGTPRRRGRSAPRRRRRRPPTTPPGTPRSSRPGRAARARTRSGSQQQDRVTAAGSRSRSGSMLVDQDRRERLHALDRDALGDLVEHVRRAPGAASASVGGPRAHVVGEQQLTARRRPQPCVDDLEGALVGDREAADLLDRRRPRTPPAAGAPRSAGRRRGCRRARRTRRAARPGRRGRRPRRRAVARRSSRSTSSPARSATGVEVAEPLDQRLQQRPHRGDDDRGPAPVVASVGGRGPSRRSTASRRPTVSRARATAARAAASPTPGSTPRRRRRGARRARVARSSASRAVAVTASTVDCCARAYVRNGRSGSGACRSSSWSPSRRSESACTRVGSVATRSARGCKVMTCPIYRSTTTGRRSVPR